VLFDRSHRDIKRLTARILEIERRVSTDDSLARAEQGQLLAEVHAKLEHGQWLAWLHEEVPLSPRTAQRLLQLGEWLSSEPALFRRLAPLGSAKLYILVTLDRVLRDRLLAQAQHVIPGTKQRRTLDLMSRDELLLVVLALTKKPALEPGVARTFSAYRRRVNALIEATDSVVALKSSIPQNEIALLHRRLVQAANKLQRAFKLPG
jgi:hypothetical protein